LARLALVALIAAALLAGTSASAAPDEDVLGKSRG
jgi:hypothetical protein